MDNLGPPLRRLVALFLLFAVAPSAGCQSVPESRGKTRAYFAKVKLTPFQIRLLVNEFAERFALRVEGVADQILAGSRSREVSRHALLWKIHGISAFFLASSRQDPLTALGDMTILAIQMRCFFEDGAASGAFGPDQPLAVTVSRELERDIVQIRSLLSDDTAGLERGLPAAFTACGEDPEKMAAEIMRELKRLNSDRPGPAKKASSRPHRERKA